MFTDPTIKTLHKLLMDHTCLYRSLQSMFLQLSFPIFSKSKTFKMKSLFLVGALTIGALGFLKGAEGASCLESLPTFKKVGEARAACVKSLKLAETDIVDMQNLKEKHFDDKCLTNCTLESVNFFSNGTIQKDKILEQLKSEASAEVYEKLAKVVEECSKPPSRHFMSTTSPKPSDKKDKKQKDGKKSHHGGRCSCKKAARFVYCMAEKEKDLC